jgi:hypothetical protein
MEACKEKMNQFYASAYFSPLLFLVLVLGESALTLLAIVSLNMVETGSKALLAFLFILFLLLLTAARYLMYGRAVSHFTELPLLTRDDFVSHNPLPTSASSSSSSTTTVSMQ